MSIVACVCIACILDLILGDPAWLPHPVVTIGRTISRCEKLLRQVFPDTAQGKQRAGLVLAVAIPVFFGLVTWGLVVLASFFHPNAGLVVQTWVCYQLLAACELRRQSQAVVHALADGGLKAGREAVSRIVGRDTAALDKAGVLRASVETVAENTSDGVVAPLFYMMVGGAPLAMAYKAVNTLDSMVGYKNGRYLDFGRASAKLDDALNWLPSRLSGLFMVVAAWLVRLDGRGAWRIWRRDRRRHASPNSAQTESACAGALGLQLAGPAAYFGKMVDKPTIGDAMREIESADVRRANWLMLATSAVALVVFGAARIGICMLATVAL